MGLRDLAQSDLGKILRDETSGFGWPITITDPDGVTANLIGFSDDISQIIDPDTGQSVSGRMASVALPMDSFSPEGMGLPQGIADSASKPWIIEFLDILGKSHKFKVAESNPDRALGVVICRLEVYKT